MSKEVAISKKIKISEAQQYMLLAALGAGIIFGVCLALVVSSMSAIEFNARILKAKDEAIKSYSSTIENIGACKAPKGDVYTAEELEQCDPNSTPLADVRGTLRANILEDLASNQSLASVHTNIMEDVCLNPKTNKKYTTSELNELYNDATDEDSSKLAIARIKSCSALRVIPDALPSQKNEEALLASLNNIFDISNHIPESLTPSGYESNYDGIEGLNSILVTLSAETDIEIVQRILNNVERSIREFGVETAVFEWRGEDRLSLTAQARAYYVDKAELNEVQMTIPAKPVVGGQEE